MHALDNCDVFIIGCFSGHDLLRVSCKPKKEVLREAADIWLGLATRCIPAPSIPAPMQDAFLKVTYSPVSAVKEQQESNF